MYISRILWILHDSRFDIVASHCWSKDLFLFLLRNILCERSSLNTIWSNVLYIKPIDIMFVQLIFESSKLKRKKKVETKVQVCSFTHSIVLLNETHYTPCMLARGSSSSNKDQMRERYMSRSPSTTFHLYFLLS